MGTKELNRMCESLFNLTNCSAVLLSQYNYTKNAFECVES